MPCLFFEPLAIVAKPQQTGGRLPLLDEYSGHCHACSEPFPAPENLQFRCCNHGYPHGACPYVPVSQVRASLRIDVRRSTPDELELLCVEELDFAPARTHSVLYRLTDEKLTPVPDTRCRQAQVLAFCRSYVRKYSIQTAS